MRTKEEMIWMMPTIIHNGCTWHGSTAVTLAMDEYAKELAIDFAKWCDDKTTRSGDDIWVWHECALTSDELFEKYLSEKQNIKP